MERTVLVTGAGSGFGLSTTLQAAVEGLRTVGLVPDHREALDLAAAAARRGLDVGVVEIDLADPEARASVAADVRPWALVNNAGYMNAGQLRDVPLEDARRQLETMVLAPMDLIRQALPAMTGRGHGRIVNVTSSAVHTSTPLTGWYAACKAALRELSDALRIELRRTGVAVVEVEPGGYRTGIWPRAAGELGERRERSSRPERYDRALRILHRLQDRMPDADRVGTAIVDALLSGNPPRHRRVGPDATVLRIASELAPERWWDRATAALAGGR